MSDEDFAPYVFRTPIIEQVFWTLNDYEFFTLSDELDAEGVTHLDGSFYEGIFSFYGETKDGGFLSMEYTDMVHPMKVWFR